MMYWRASAAETGALAAQMAGSEQRTSAALARARAASLRTAASNALAQRLHVEARSKQATLDGLSAQAVAQADKAATASKAADAVLKGMKASSASILAQAASLSVEDVRRLFAGEYERQNDWRQKTLRDYYTEASDAATDAAAPYRALEQQARASAQRLQVAALSAGGGNAKQRMADVADAEATARETFSGGEAIVSARQDVGDAMARHAVAVRSAIRARSLQASADEANSAVAAYAEGARAAASNAARTVDPFGMPPLPVADISSAFLPPSP